MTKLYSIRDVLAKAFGPPFTAKNDDVAVRQFRNLISEVPSYDQENYKLYCVGEFRNEDEEMDGQDVFEFVIEGCVPKLVELEVKGDILIRKGE